MIGAGPCGIGAVRELDRLGVAPLVVLEAADRAGGLAASVVDDAGFTWDRGGHVVFSHFGEFDRLLLEVLGDAVLHHDRSSWVLAAGTWVPYPFQNNLHRLPPAIAEACLVGLVEAATSGPAPQGDFASWAGATFGAGVVEHFMAPYNRKVWATEPSDLSAGWIAERVSVVDWRAVLGRALQGVDDISWGPNNRFAFPAEGGTGRIWTEAAKPYADRIRYRTTVTAVDPHARVVRTSTGEEVPYRHLVSTMALDQLVARVVEAPDDVREAAASLVHTTVHVVGVGYEAPVADERSWLYFADPEIPFYRATNFAKYSPANVPESDTDRYSSWMCEVGSSATHPVDADGLGERVEAALRSSGVVAGRPTVASLHVEEVPYAYPVPTRGRDAALAVVLPWLDAHGIYSRGRFGTWRYEVGNMDHAVKMGIDVARRIATGAPEALVPTPLARAVGGPR
ncbi:FAD-dependent oxidoreductase [soil metagenome]